MAKVKCIFEIWCFELDCGHTLTGGMAPDVQKVGTEVDCHVCADIEKQVKAARLEALKEMRQELCLVTALELQENWRIIQNMFDGIFDKRIAELEAE